MASIIMTPSVTYTHSALTSVAHVKFFAGGEIANRAVSSFQFDFSTAGLTGLTAATFGSVDSGSFWVSPQFSLSNSTPSNVLRITGAQANPAGQPSSNAPIYGVAAANELAAFDLTFNRPLAGTSDLVFTRTGPTDFSGLFQLRDTTGAVILSTPANALDPVYGSTLSITIPQQAGGAAVPEPGSVVAISAVLGGLGIRALRRRRKAQII